MTPGTQVPLRDTFTQSGHVGLGRVVDDALGAELLGRLTVDLQHRAHADRLDLTGSGPDGAPGVFTVLLDWWQSQSDVTASLTATLARRSAELLDVALTELISDETFVKPSGHGGAMQWHQDFAVYAEDNRSFVTCWVALSDATPENGAVQVAQGSHLLGRFVPHEVARGHVPAPPAMAELMASRPALPDPEESGLPLLHLCLPFGHASAHHSLLWHRSGANGTDQPRYGVALRFRSIE